MDSRSIGSVVVDEEEAKLKAKHQGLLREYLYLQKECVSKKRKLKESKERKVTLLDQIRFLKDRRNSLLKKQLQNSEQKQEIYQSHNKTMGKNSAELSRRYMNASGQAFQNHRPPMIPIRNSGSAGKQKAASVSLNLGKKTKNVFSHGKRAEKRKISWQDQLALKA